MGSDAIFAFLRKGLSTRSHRRSLPSPITEERARLCCPEPSPEPDHAPARDSPKDTSETNRYSSGQSTATSAHQGTHDTSQRLHHYAANECQSYLGPCPQLPPPCATAASTRPSAVALDFPSERWAKTLLGPSNAQGTSERSPRALPLGTALPPWQSDCA